jgi:hypothetical protein
MKNTFQKSLALTLLISTSSFSSGFKDNSYIPTATVFTDTNHDSNIPTATAIVVDPEIIQVNINEALVVLENELGFKDKTLPDVLVRDMANLIESHNYSAKDIKTIGEYIHNHNTLPGILRLIVATAPYDRVWLLDDSGSMDYANSTWYDALDGFKKKTTKRFEELRNRLHLAVVGFAYLPANEKLVLQFLNRTNVLNFCRGEYTPEQYIQYMHSEIDKAFAMNANGSTPIFKKLTALYDFPQPTHITLFCDGEPDNGAAAVSNLILKRNAENFPTTLVSISDDDKALKWMKDADENGKRIAELDDIISELGEIIAAHGIGITYLFTAQGGDDFFPANYTQTQRYVFARDIIEKLKNEKKLDEIIINPETLKGLLGRYLPTWLVCHQYAAFDSNGLDALDEKGEIITREVFGDLMGVELAVGQNYESITQKYDLYVRYHPITLGLDKAKNPNQQKEIAQNSEQLRNTLPNAGNILKKNKYANALNETKKR